MRIGPLLFVILAPLFSACQDGDTGSGGDLDPVVAVVTSDPLPLTYLIDSLHLDAKTIRFHVDKSERRFGVYMNDRLLKTYPCVLGEHAVGDKMMQGDRKTPEGTFGFRSKRMHDKWHAFVWVDYPNAESRRRFAQRQESGVIPANADIGGEIGIHGVPAGMDHWISEGVDWTWGCIALRNDDLDEIYPFILPERTTMEIVP
ncbi:MAG: L,D-transpeptidase [Flavobacteriales bacterium]